uniref:Conserved oligomeric Golgi complex subunit 1 n=1 Tax=Coprinellus disseminatus TaxID=71703 RepID=Q1WMT0_COPDI|nr:conserved hypothetical protein [Coprinellus disseminatus]
MLRRGSTISSAKSVSSPVPNGIPTPGYSRLSAGLAPSLQSSQSTKQSFGFDTPNPDDLFSRYTVAEVKNIQARLRNDADIKQEELRLMVGERYRDLLQASTSIISMAVSSRRVLDAIEECRGSIIAQEEPPMPSRSMGFGGSVNDRHLHTLQLLSAHVKVLLDAPEHLWRLIERKDYLLAAWLFLFTRSGLMFWYARIQSHSDIRADSKQAEFPLVQRQWDEISSFRSQIIHKSSLSLREIKSSSQAVCATLITLHLLDSRPLREAFNALLTQRTKAVTALISWKIHSSANGRPTARFGSSFQPPISRPSTAQEILQANEKVLTAIIDTVHTSRQIFQIPPAQQASLISSALHCIQEEKPRSKDVQVPPGLVPSTHALLTNSSSSAHFLLLPAALQSYKPYIDLESSSLIYSQADFRQVLHEWLQKSTKSWRSASSSWLIELGTVGQIWSLRISLRAVVSEAQLEEAEKRELASTLDALCHDRILGVWKTTLERAQDTFQAEFAKLLSSLKERIERTSISFLAERTAWLMSCVPQLVHLSDPQLHPLPPKHRSRVILRHSNNTRRR